MGTLRRNRAVFPWRVSATSCTLEADLLSNVRALAPWVDNVEILLWCQADDHLKGNWPTAEEIEELGRLAREYALTYTVHLPSSLGGIKYGPAYRGRVLAQIKECARLLAPLCPLAYVWHWESELWGAVPACDCGAWKEHLALMAGEVAACRLLPPERLCVETLSYPYELIVGLVRRFGFGTTLDVGHLWQAGLRGPVAWRHLLAGSRLLHLHGCDAQGHDHLSLSVMERSQVRAFLRDLATACSQGDELFPRVLTLEVFSWEEWQSSYHIMADICSSWP